MPDLSGMSVQRLLALYADVIDELRHKGAVRSKNNPVADYAESLVVRALGLRQVTKSTAGHDAVDENGLRFEIKSRRVTPGNPSRQMSAIRGLENRPFDFLIGVIFAPDFTVQRACMAPIDVVRETSKFVKHTNSWKLVLHDSLWLRPGVRDITDRLVRAQPDWSNVPTVVDGAEHEPAVSGPVGQPSPGSATSSPPLDGVADSDPRRRVWDALVRAAEARQTLTYAELTDRIAYGIPQGVGTLLEAVQDFCREREIPALTSLVVNKKTGLPSAGFLGGPKPISEMQADVFEYNWDAVRFLPPRRSAD